MLWSTRLWDVPVFCVISFHIEVPIFLLCGEIKYNYNWYYRYLIYKMEPLFFFFRHTNWDGLR